MSDKSSHNKILPPREWAVELKDSPWIIQPFEKYEEIRIEDLKKSQR